VNDAESDSASSSSTIKATSNPVVNTPKRGANWAKNKKKQAKRREQRARELLEGDTGPSKTQEDTKDAEQQTLRSRPRTRRMSLPTELVEPQRVSTSPVSTTASDPGTAESPIIVIRFKNRSPWSAVGGQTTLVEVGGCQGGNVVTPAATEDRSAQPPTHVATSSNSGTKTVEPEFLYDLTYHTFECALQGCEKRCSFWDGVSVNCPACGPLSTISYCGKEHMREDVPEHWPHCGLHCFQRPSRLTTVPDRISSGPPMIPSIHEWDSPERHRQAVWFSTSSSGNEGDYFIFYDYQELTTAGTIDGSANRRCSSRVYLTVSWNGGVERDRFRRILAVCLLASVEHPLLVCYLFRLIRDRLRSRGQWSEYVDAMLRWQFGYELGVQVDQAVVGERHACRVEWNRRNLRYCCDPVCMSERVALYGGGGWVNPGFSRLCDDMESSYWLLRANRTTHPTTKSVAARIRGQGYSLMKEHRRLFRRGEGWDGLGSGPLEIEDWED
jgi:hypothetical protein